VLAKLVIVVDEFAELVRASRRDDSALLESLVKIAAQGRAYGMHLVLATQDPASAITDEILRNTQVRVALKVVDRGASRSIIESDEAALLPRWARGRAYMWVDHQVEPFQTAFSSGAAGATAVSMPRVVDQPWPHVNARLPTERASTRQTQLAAVVEAIGATGAPRAVQLFAEALPDRLSLRELADRPELDDAGVPGLVVGLEDLVEEQRLGAFAIDLAATGNVLFAGKSDSGRTGFLRTVAIAACEGGIEVHAIGRAHEFADLVDAGCLASAVDPADALGLGTLARALAAEADPNRRARVMHPVLALVDGIDDLLHSGRDGPPELLDPLRAVLRDGPARGVFVVATAKDPVERFNVSFRTTIVGPHDAAAASDFGVTRDTIARLRAPGAAVVRRPDGEHRVTIAYVDEIPPVTSTTAGRVRFAALPDAVSWDDLVARSAPRPDTAIVGLRVTDGGSPLDAAVPAEIEFGSGVRAVLVVAGGPGAGKTNALAVLGASFLLAGRPVVVVDGSRRANRPVLSETLDPPPGSLVLGAGDDLPADLADDAVLLVDDFDPNRHATVTARLANVAERRTAGIVVVSVSGAFPSLLSDIAVPARRALLLGPWRELTYTEKDAFAPPHASFQPDGTGGRGLLVVDGVADPVAIPLVPGSAGR
jgi:S-DNA-T family DNA segregation ATPase FtsK/SpoIIIE